METKEQLQQRVDRTLEKIKAVLAEENCELEPFVLIVSGNLVKKEINIVAKPMPKPVSTGEGGAN